MFEAATSGEPRNRLTDWVLRGGIGQWFRYFTGVVEIAGGLLVVIPWTARAGLALLAVTMACAALILDFVVRRPADSIISMLFFILLAAHWWIRRNG